jgi:hypothetical protein
MWLYVFLIPALDGDELLDSRSDGFNLREKTLLHASNKRLGGPQGQSGRMRKRYISCPGRKSIL